VGGGIIFLSALMLGNYSGEEVGELFGEIWYIPVYNTAAK
jgi:hypothetical protein